MVSFAMQKPLSLIRSRLFIYLFFYFWLCWVFIAVHRLSLLAASGATLCCGEWVLLFVAVSRLHIVMASLAVEHRL